MVLDFTLRTIRNGDFGNILRLWNATHEDEPINNVTLKRKVFLDPNFDPEGFIITETGDKLNGFIYVVMRKVVVDAGGELEPEKAWINGIGILADSCGSGKSHDKQSGNTADFTAIGMQLLAASEDFARKRGAKKINAMDYSPAYFIQGFDVGKQQQYVDLFQKAGYAKASDSVSMDIDLAAYKEAEEVRKTRESLEAEGFAFCHLSDELLLSLFCYLSKYQKPGWTHRVRKLLLEREDYTFVTVVTYKGEVIGFNIHGDTDSSLERFGPFGVREDFRGKGLGKVLLSECLLTMKARGLHNAWFQWGSRNSAAYYVYKKLGFTESNIYVSFTRKL